ncbi:helix-turn-helix domain-containing protein [Microbacterium aerolatum]|uniref:helix-turn-helix domain-containing protein n=1 Tax=Microbacterium aerolatum TaxID=153731 RepID=UPI002000DA37|nr:helix-turn-helix domain-containing protein [Microbacterium aerolatum]MCK3768554.1 helix-turn-helix domain-containing protein [Microbacterium aerolatum]
MATDGFVRLPNWFIEHDGLSAPQLLVYIVLLKYRNSKTGTCHPGFATIADEARISRKAVMNAIFELERFGYIEVTRSVTPTGRNNPNVYKVGLPSKEQPAHIWETSAKGKRKPQRNISHETRKKLADAARRRDLPSAPEALPEGVVMLPSASQAPPSDSEALPLVPPRHSNKTTDNKTKEQAMRLTLASERNSVSFEIDEHTATSKQIDYLNDLHIFLTARLPEKRTRAKWEALTTTDASNLIETYWKQMDRGRGGMWESPVDEYHPLYQHLSEHGRRWIANGCLPDSAYEYAS